MKILFYGTPELSVPFLSNLVQSHDVVGVITQPDKPLGRNLNITPSPVKAKALNLGLKVFQPDRLDALSNQEIRALAPDLAILVAYGRILKRNFLEIPKLGNLNIHFSLLPKYRGAAPIQRALLSGERKTGVTGFWMDEGMDTGPVFLRKEAPVEECDDAVTLTAKLTSLGVEVLGETLLEIQRGNLFRAPQSGEPSYAPRIRKEEGRVDLGRPAYEVHNQIRAFLVWPKAHLWVRGLRINILKSALSSPSEGENPIGAVLRVERGKGFLVQCREGRLWIAQVQPEGKRIMPAEDFLNGIRLKEGGLLL